MKRALALAALLLSLALVPIATPCNEEDSTLCNWDASKHGNGVGSSYVALTDEFRLIYGGN